MYFLIFLLFNISIFFSLNNHGEEIVGKKCDVSQNKVIRKVAEEARRILTFFSFQFCQKSFEMYQEQKWDKNCKDD